MPFLADCHKKMAFLRQTGWNLSLVAENKHSFLEKWLKKMASLRKMSKIEKCEKRG